MNRYENVIAHSGGQVVSSNKVLKNSTCCSLQPRLQRADGGIFDGDRSAADRLSGCRDCGDGICFRVAPDRKPRPAGIWAIFLITGLLLDSVWVRY